MDEPPKVVLAAIHSVRNFEEWFASIHEWPAPGLLNRAVYRSSDDPDEVMVAVEFASVEAAQAAIPGAGLREWLDRSGIDVYPAVFIGELVDRQRSVDPPIPD
jgi:hypothetical protein